MSLIAKVMSKTNKEKKASYQVAPGVLHLANQKKKKGWQRILLIFLPLAMAAIGYASVQYLTTKRPTPPPLPRQIERQKVELAHIQPPQHLQGSVSLAEPKAVSPTQGPVGETKEVQRVDSTPAEPLRPETSQSHPPESKKALPSQPPQQKKEKKVRPSEPQKKEAKDRDKKETPEPELVRKNELERDFLLYQARSMEDQKKHIEAIEYYKKAELLDQTNYKLQNKIAALCLSIKDVSCAMEYIKKATQNQPSYVPALVNKGIVLALEGRDEEAEAVFLEIVRLAPSNKTGLLNLGYLYEKKGKLQQAYDTYHLLAREGDPEGLLGLARVMEAMQRWDEAIGVYSEICSLQAADESLKKYASTRLSVLAPMMKHP